jgi:hypothetical protein
VKTKIHQSLIVIGICILVTSNIALFSLKTNYNSNYSNKHILPSTSTIGTNLSPFFNHLEEDTELYLQLNDTGDSYDADYWYHAFTNDPEFTISDNTYFAADISYFLLGFANSLVDINTVDYSGTALWDDTQGGFYTKTLDSLTNVSSEKKVFDNLLYTLALLEGAEAADNPSSVVNIITESWNDVVNVFWDSSNTAFNHSNANIDQRYSADNLLGAIVAFSIAKSSLFSQSVRDNARTYGTNIMDEFVPEMYVDTLGQEGFYNTTDIENNKIGSNNKVLLTNALGIWALLEWNIAKGYTKSSSEVLKAEAIWRFLNSKLLNGANDLYITETNFDGNIAINSDMYLLYNAWMIKSSLELFKQTGNSTYYLGALDNFYGIEQHLYDQTNHAYSSLVGSSEKTLDSYGMLIYALNDFYDIFIQSEILLTYTQTEFIYEIDPWLNFTLAYNITMDISYPGIGESWSISAPIADADISYVLRYAENDTIISTDLSTTNATGQDFFNYDLSTITSFYEYKLEIFCNRTGFNVGIKTINFPFSSGIEIVNIKKMDTKLHQGSTARLNITYTSSHPKDINATTVISGDNFIQTTSKNFIIKAEDIIDGKFESSIVVNVTASEEAEIGIQSLDIIVLNNNSKAFFHSEYEIKISSVIEVNSLLVDQYLVNFAPLRLHFDLYNHHLIDTETVRIEINSTYFDYFNTTYTNLLPLSQKDLYVYLNPNEHAKLGILDFLVTIWRDDVIIFTKEVNIQSVPEIIIHNIYSTDRDIIQGQTPTVTLEIYSYNSSNTKLYIFCNGRLIGEKTVSFGESRFTIDMDNPIRNPYNIGEESYQIIIKDVTDKTLASKVISVNIKPSTLNIFIFYVLPVLIPIGVIIYFKYKELEQIKRTK